MTFALALLLLAQLSDPIIQAEQNLRAGRCPEVIESLTEMLRTDSKSPEAAYRLLAECQSTAGRPDDSERTLRSGLLRIPDSAQLAKALAQVLFRKNPENAEAGELFRRTVTALPQDLEARHYYSQWAYLNNLEKLCVEHERAALEQRQRLPELALLQMYTLLGMCEARSDNVSAARDAFQSAMSINLRAAVFDPAQAYQFVQFLVRAGMASEAEPVIEEVVRRTPQFGPGQLELAKVHERARRLEAAIEAAKRALAGEGNSPANLRAAHALLAKCYFILGRTAEAEAEQKWIEGHPAFSP